MNHYQEGMFLWLLQHFSIRLVPKVECNSFPDGKLFSWRSVFDGIQGVVQQLPQL